MSASGPSSPLVLINSCSLFQVQSYLTLSIVNYGVSKHYAGSMVSDRCPLGYLFFFAGNFKGKLINKRKHIW